MQADGSSTFYFIFDSGDKETKDLVNNVSDTLNVLEMAVEAGVAYKADTLEELAEAAGLADLSATVGKYNAAIEAGTDEEFGRDTSTMIPIKNGPFYAMQCKKAILGIFGGLNTNLTGEVVTADEEMIPGLYAAGEVANGELLSETLSFLRHGSGRGDFVRAGSRQERSGLCLIVGEQKRYFVCCLKVTALLLWNRRGGMVLTAESSSGQFGLWKGDILWEKTFQDVIS